MTTPIRGRYTSGLCNYKETEGSRTTRKQDVTTALQRPCDKNHSSLHRTSSTIDKMVVGGISASAAAESTSAVAMAPPVGEREMTWDELRDLVECPICLCVMVSVTDPRALPCLHTFCLQCLAKYSGSLSSKKGRAPKALPCPYCRREAELPRTGPRSLPKNCMVSRIADALRHPVQRAQAKPALRPQPSAPELPVGLREQRQQQRRRPEPSAPALEQITSGGCGPLAGGAPTTRRPVPMRQRSTHAASLPRPNSAPDIPVSSPAPIVDITPRRRYDADDDGDVIWGRNRNRKEKPSLFCVLLGNFLSATR